MTQDHDLVRIRREIEIMASLSHQHIIQIYEGESRTPYITGDRQETDTPIVKSNKTNQCSFKTCSVTERIQDTLRPTWIIGR